MFIYVAIFLVITFFAVEFEIGESKSIWPLTVLAIFLILFAGLRNPEVPRDYVVYQFIFDNIDNPSISASYIRDATEPGFYAVILFFKWLFPNFYSVAIMMFCASVAVGLVTISLYKNLWNPYIGLLFYYSNFYFLHEMTQVRIGLALSIILAGLPFFFKRRNLVFSAFIILASLFHYSAIILFGLFLFRRDHFSKTWFAILWFSSLLIGSLRINTIGILNILSSITNTSSKFSTYLELTTEGMIDQVNIFNVFNLLTMFLNGYLLYIIPKEDFIKNPRLSFFLKSNIISVFLLCINSSNALMAFRVSEIFGIFSIFLYPYLVKYLPFKKFNIWFVALFAFVFFFINILYGHLLNPYRIYDFNR